MAEDWSFAFDFLIIVALPLGLLCVKVYVCRRVTARSGLVCLKCGGDLVVQESDTQCHKCHTHCPWDEVKAQWEEWKPPCWNAEGMDA